MDETSQEQFTREQAEFEALYGKTPDPLVLAHALRNTRARGQSPLPWLVSAIGPLLEQQSDEAATDERRRLVHFVRWRVVVGLRRAGCAPEEALDLACDLLAGQRAAAARSTIRNSFWLVENDVKEKGTASKFKHLLNAQTQGLGQAGVMRAREPAELQPLDLRLEAAIRRLVDLSRLRPKSG
jgi:hypothetical protein